MTSRPSRRLSSTAVLLALPLLLAPLGGGGCMVTTTAATPGTYGASGGLEYDHDRAGSDYRSFDLPEPRPDLCLSYCQNEAQCLAFTYVKPGIQGPAPRCWLKSAIPPATANACCVSGVVRSQPAQAAAPPPPPPPGPTGGAYETDYDRGGSDYRSFDLPEPRPELCRGTCEREAQCLAFTYVKPGVQGPSARCWLKSEIPQATPNACCVSGVVRAAAAPPPAAAASGLEHDTDRPGLDYRNFNLPEPAPELCQSACAREPQCLAFTYVKPGVQGPAPRCWLKSSVPPPRPNGCCVSGVK